MNASGVGSHSVCASACFIIFAAGTRRQADEDTAIGVHGVSEKNGVETESGGLDSSLSQIIARVRGDERNPRQIGQTPPSDIAWLTKSELVGMGVEYIEVPK